MMNTQTPAVYRNTRMIRHLEPLEFELVKRDIFFFYEQQTQWATISGNLDFFDVFKLPYWDYLDLRGEIDQSDKQLVRTGSLLLVLSECLEFFEDAGTYALANNQKRMQLADSVISLTPIDEEETEIRTLILGLLQGIEKDDLTWNKEWDHLLNKLFVTHIYGYFRNKYHTFENHWEILYQRYRNSNTQS